jgi:GTP 3',8-cyclase
MTGLSDSFQRPINYMRISVTDRCNLRCVYCMPEDGIFQLNHSDILNYEEIAAIVRAGAELGITKVRITGGEPLVRLGIADLVRMLSGIGSLDDISMTTNGMLLARYAADLKKAGLNRVNISLDTLNPEKFRKITRGGRLEDVLEGIEAARAVGLNPVKMNMVVMAGVNDDEIADFAAKTMNEEWHIRFIEIMPFAGDGTPRGLSAKEMKAIIDPLGKLQPFKNTIGNGPARYFRFPGAKGTIGFITPVSEHFCFSCNRLRLTADGKLRPCLMSDSEIDVKQCLRTGASPDELKALIRQAVTEKPMEHHMVEGQKPVTRPLCQIGG